MAPPAGIITSPAPLGRRAAAYIVDWCTALIIGLLLCGATIALLLAASDIDRRDPPDWSLYLSLVLLFAWLPTWFASTTLFWFVRGATLGMHCAGIVLVDLNGGLPGLGRSALRAATLALLTGPAAAAPVIASILLSLGTLGPIFVALPVLLLLCLSIAACLSVVFRRDRRAWHDLLSGTQLVLAPRHGTAS